MSRDGAEDAGARGEIADGCRRRRSRRPRSCAKHRENVKADIDIGCTVVASDPREPTATRVATAHAEIAGCYLANKVQNIQGSADTPARSRRLEQDEIRPVAARWSAVGSLAAKELVTDAILDKCKPDDRRHARGLHRGDRGVQGCGLHARDARAVGQDRHEQIRLFASACSRTSETDHGQAAVDESLRFRNRCLTPAMD